MLIESRKFETEQANEVGRPLLIMPCWYYEKRELRNTPSIRDGVPFDTERRYRKEGARFIMSCGTQLGLGHNTMATGVVYFHRFYMFQSFRSFPRYVTACCCLLLAGKVEETPKKCRDLIATARGLLADNYFYSFGEDPKEEVMTLERILLQTIKFDLQVEHPYTFLLKYAKCFKGDQQKLQKMVQMAWNFVNDSLSTVVCLQWEPEIIAVALIHLASKLSKFTVTDWQGRQPQHQRWWDMFVSDMTMEILEDICHQVLDLYQNTPQQPAATAPPSPPQKPPSRTDSPPPSATRSGRVADAMQPPPSPGRIKGVPLLPLVHQQQQHHVMPPPPVPSMYAALSDTGNIQTIKTLAGSSTASMAVHHSDVGASLPPHMTGGGMEASTAAMAAAYHMYATPPPPLQSPHHSQQQQQSPQLQHRQHHARQQQQQTQQQHHHHQQVTPPQQQQQQQQRHSLPHQQQQHLHNTGSTWSQPPPPIGQQQSSHYVRLPPSAMHPPPPPSVSGSGAHTSCPPPPPPLNVPSGRYYVPPSAASAASSSSSTYGRSQRY